MRYTVNDRQAGPYRSRDGILLGVCRGLADYFDVSAFWVRLAAVAMSLMTGFWPTLAMYVVAALLMKPEPVIRFTCESDEEFYDSYAASRSRALHRLKRIYDKMERRIQRIEGRITGKEYDWDRRMRES